MNNRSKNQGITLVELIVVVAIMMVFLSIVGLRLSLISRQRTTNAANSTKSMMQMAQTYAKSKADCVMKITAQNDGGAEITIETEDSKGNMRVGNGAKEVHKQISIIVEYDNGESVTVAPGTDPVEIKFDRKTGGFKDVTIPGSGEEATPTKITFTNGSKTTSLILAKNTGVITFEAQAP